jgi:hypothetical protein
MNALVASDCPFLESYENQSWPADMFVAMASISNHDKIFIPRYQSEIHNWLLDVKEKLRIKKILGKLPMADAFIIWNS